MTWCMSGQCLTQLCNILLKCRILAEFNSMPCLFCVCINVVSYNDVDMNALQADVDQAIINACEQCSHCCTYHTHDISASEVAEAIIRLKQSKRDGSSEVMSDHLLFACDSLNLYLALLFTMMLRHGVAPNDMLIGTIIPIPKGRWANLCL